MKKGFTFIEVAIAIGLLGMIMVSVSTIFITSVKNYRANSQRSFFQKEINFAIDDVGKNIKTATKVLPTYDTYTSNSTRMILALPATDRSGNFMYNSGVILQDIFIYEFSGNTLKRRIIANPSGIRTSGEAVILDHVSAVSFTYDPELNLSPNKVTALITLSTPVNNRNISVSSSITNYLRNKQ